MEVTQVDVGVPDGYSGASDSKTLRSNWPFGEAASFGPAYWWPTAVSHPPNGSSMVVSSTAL